MNTLSDGSMAGNRHDMCHDRRTCIRTSASRIRKYICGESSEVADLRAEDESETGRANSIRQIRRAHESERKSQSSLRNEPSVFFDAPGGGRSEAMRQDEWKLVVVHPKASVGM